MATGFRMDQSSKSTKECSVENEDGNSAVGENPNIEVNPNITQSGSNKTAVKDSKHSLLEESIKVKTEKISANDSCVNDTNNCTDSAGVLQITPITVQSETIVLPCVNNENNKLKFYDNSTCMASSDRHVINVEPNKDVSDTNIKTDKINIKDCKIDRGMENEKTKDTQTNGETKITPNLDNKNCSLVFTSNSELCQDNCNTDCGNITTKSKVTKIIMASNNNKQFLNVNKNCENFQNTNSINAECDKRIVSQNSKTNDLASDTMNAEDNKRAINQNNKTHNRIVNITTKKKIGEDTKLVVDGKPPEEGEPNNENIEHSNMANDGRQRMKQELPNSKHTELLINDRQSPDRGKGNSNVIGAAQDGINKVIKKQIGKEELSCNEIKTMETSVSESGNVARDGINDVIEKQIGKEDLSCNTIEAMETSVVIEKTNKSYQKASNNNAGEINTSDKRDNEINNRVADIVIKKDPLVGGDTKLIVDDNCSKGEKDDMLCKDFERPKEMSDKKQSVRQELPNNKYADLIIDDKQSPDKVKGNSNAIGVENGVASRDRINDVTEKQNGKVELSYNKMETSAVTENTNKPHQNASDNIKTSPELVRKRERKSSKSSSKCTSLPCSSSPLPSALKGGRSRGRSGGNFVLTKAHLVPFKLGWLREVVERATCSSPKRMWDVYYRTPDGTKKMRSMPDVVSYLKLHPESGLTAENFTFFKTHIYREPFELTRKAKARPNNLTPNSKTLKQENKSKSSPSSIVQAKPEVVCDEPPKKKAKPNSCKDESVVEENSVLQEIIVCKDEPTKKKVKPNTCKVEIITKDKPSSKAQETKPNKRVPLILNRRSNRQRNVDATITRTKAPNIYEKVYTKLTKPRNDYSRPLRKLCSQPAVSMQYEIKTPVKDVAKNKSAVSKSALVSHLNEKINKITIKLHTENSDLNKKTSKSSNEEMSAIDVNLCSNRCPGSAGEIPSLQCIVCLCLFHPICMGLNKAATNFICKRCNTTKPSRNKTQKKLHKNVDKAATQSSSTDSLEHSDSDSIDEDSATNVSVLAPEVVIQHEGSDQDEVLTPAALPYRYSQISTGAINTVPGQYQQIVLNNKTNFIRPAPPLTPFTSLSSPLQTSHQLLSSKRVTASSTYFPPPLSDTAAIRVSSNNTSNTYPSASFANCNMPTLIPSSKPNCCSTFIDNPPICSPLRFASPPRLINTLQPPPLGVPLPTLAQNPINTRPPPLRLVAPASIPPGVGNCNRIVLSNAPGSCLVLAPRTGVLASGTATRLIGPFSPGSLPQIMVVNNKVIYVNPVSNKQLPEQRSPSLISNVTSASSLTVCSSQDISLEQRATCMKAEQNNPYLAALLNKSNIYSPLTGNLENNAAIKNTDMKATNITLSSSSLPTSTITVIDGKTSTVPPKLTAIIPPSFPASKGSSILKCTNATVTTTGSCLLPTFSFMSGSNTSLESPYSSESSYTQECNLAKRIEEQFKSCTSTAQTVVLPDSSSGLLNTNINKRMETSTTPAIKSPMTTSRLLKGTESSLSFPEVKTKSSENSNLESNKNKVKLMLPSPSLNIENQLSSESLEDSVSVGAKQNSFLEKHTCSLRSNSIRDQPFRTTAFTPAFTTGMSTMTSCYNCLNNIFQYLTITDLLRVKLVCKCWYRLASQQFLWQKISLRNLIIVDWRKFASAIDLHGTTYLDLRGHILFHDTWQNFVSVLNRLDKLQHMECGLIPAFVLYAMASKLVHLKSLTGECAMFSHWTTGRVGPCVINFNLLENFKEMEKFRLKCKEGLMATVMGGLLPISHLTKLRHLSLTTLEGVDSEQFKFLNKLSNLERLEIGECVTWTRKIYDSIGKMTNLRILRLEKGGEIDGLVEALSNLSRLKELHLVAYKIPPSLGIALQKLEVLRILSLWPDTTSNGPFQNCKALHAVNGLTHLRELRWVILSNNSDIIDKADDGNCWRERLEDYKECQIDFSDPSSDVPLVPIVELNKNVAKSRSWKNAPRCITVNGLRESLQKTLPSTEIKMFQVPMQQLRKYSAFR